jgi:hypothetical protein
VVAKVVKAFRFVVGKEAGTHSGNGNAGATEAHMGRADKGKTDSRVNVAGN